MVPSAGWALAGSGGGIKEVPMPDIMQAFLDAAQTAHASGSEAVKTFVFDCVTKTITASNIVKHFRIQDQMRFLIPTLEAQAEFTPFSASNTKKTVEITNADGTKAPDNKSPIPGVSKWTNSYELHGWDTIYDKSCATADQTAAMVSYVDGYDKDPVEKTAKEH